MATESLIVKLQGDTDDLNKDLSSTTGQLDKLDKSTSKTDKALGAMSKTASSVAGALKTVAVTTIAATTATTAMVAVMADQAKQIKINATLMNESVEGAQMWAAATKTVGIDLEKLGDISKDTNEKIGEFTADGTGGFSDFVTVMGLTEKQAKDTAKEFAAMSGPDVLQEMVRQMDSAGASAGEMSWALEGMASDTTLLIPLLENNSEKLKELNEDYMRFNRSLSESDIEKLADLDNSFKGVFDTFKNTMTRIAVSYSDTFDEMNDTTREQLVLIGDEFASGAINERVSAMTSAILSSWDVAFGDMFEISDNFTGDFGQMISDIAVAFLEFTLTLPINLKKAGVVVSGIWSDIVNDIMMGMAEANLAIQEGLDLVGAGDIESAQRQIEFIEKRGEMELAANGERIAQLEAEKQAILEKFRAENEAATNTRTQYVKDHSEKMRQIEVEKQVKAEIESLGGGGVDGLSDKEKAAQDAKFEAAVNAIATEEDLRRMAYEKEVQDAIEGAEYLREIQLEQYEQGLIDEQEYQDRLADIRNSEDSKLKELTKNHESTNKDKESSDEAYLNSAISIGQTLGKENEAVQAATIVATTAAGISRQFADLPFPAALATSAAIAISGAAQLASIGSGSISGSSSSTPADTTTTEPDIIVSNNDTSGQTQNLVISFDESGDLGALGAFLNTATNKAIQDGLV